MPEETAEEYWNRIKREQINLAPSPKTWQEWLKAIEENELTSIPKKE